MFLCFKKCLCITEIWQKKRERAARGRTCVCFTWFQIPDGGIQRPAGVTLTPPEFGLSSARRHCYWHWAHSENSRSGSWGWFIFYFIYFFWDGRGRNVARRLRDFFQPITCVWFTYVTPPTRTAGMLGEARALVCTTVCTLYYRNLEQNATIYHHHIFFVFKSHLLTVNPYDMFYNYKSNNLSSYGYCGLCSGLWNAKKNEARVTVYIPKLFIKQPI